MKNCFGYVRVSSQRQGEGVSLEAQRDAILAFAERNNIAIVEWFEEKETAAKLGRPIFNRMIKLLRQRKAHGVVLHKPDRAARNFADWAKMGDLADAGIDVHFASESLDFRSRGGRLSADIQAVIAADYIRNLKEEIHKGQRGQLERGIYPFGAPIGYLNNGGNKTKTIDPTRGPLVKRVFELYASGEHSLRTLLVAAQEMGLRTATGNNCSKGTLEAILSNPFYAGVIRLKQSGKVYEGIHEPLISANLFESVQLVRSGKSGKKVTKHMHTYRGLFACDQCGTSMIAERQKGHVYYRCHTPSCASNSIREEALEQAIADIIKRVELTDEAMKRLVSQVTTWIELHTQTPTPSSYAMQIENITQRLERLTDTLIDRLIDSETFNVRKQALMLERTMIKEKMEADAKKALEPSRVHRFLELVKSLYSTYLIATKDEKRQIVKNATSNRKVFGKKVYIEPSNWLRDTQIALGVLICGDAPPTSRSSHDMISVQLDRLLRASEELEALEEV
jgi:DNA invertase Pin-like site-specific DNA recombinase